MVKNDQRLQEFEALRAVSILLLLILHSDVFSLQVFGIELGPISFFVAAFLLGSFFFLAGYFYEVSLQKPGQNIFFHIKSKFARILPPYWLALALFVFVMRFTLKKFDLLVYLLNLQFIFSPVFVKQLLTLWYISIVVSYYVIFGTLQYYAKSNMVLLAKSLVLYGAAFALYKMTGLLDGRFFEYFFIFLAGFYFSRLQLAREWLFNLDFTYKVIIALLGAWLFRLVLVAGYEITNGYYLLAVNFYIFSWVLMWLEIFRTHVGAWRIWSPIATASFFVYLYHRPIWYIFGLLLSRRLGLSSIMFQLIPGSIVALIICYFLQKGYDAILRAIRNYRIFKVRSGA